MYAAGKLACFAGSNKAPPRIGAITNGIIRFNLDLPQQRYPELNNTTAAPLQNSRHPMFEIVLYQPEIPPNTGNIMRLCANTGCRLHLVRPLGFSIADRHLERAGMDYRERTEFRVHDDWNACLVALGQRRLFAITTRGSTPYHRLQFQSGDAFIFGPETRGLPQDILENFSAESRLQIPMAPQSRSLNLANAVGVVVYEAWRQNGFAGAAT